MAEVEKKLIYVEPDSPDRCQGVHGTGQCRYRHSEGSAYCPMHGGHAGNNAHKKAIHRQYQLAKWQSSVDGFADEDQVKSLRGEIGIARMVLETYITKCKDTSDLMMFAPRIAVQITQIERLVSSCHRLESNLGLLLDKTKILNLAAIIVEIIGQHVTDEDAVSAISTGIVNAIVATQGSTKDGNT